MKYFTRIFFVTVTCASVIMAFYLGQAIGKRTTYTECVNRQQDLIACIPELRACETHERTLFQMLGQCASLLSDCHVWRGQ